jgi:hypothetical protein
MNAEIAQQIAAAARESVLADHRIPMDLPNVRAALAAPTALEELFILHDPEVAAVVARCRAHIAVIVAEENR